TAAYMTRYNSFLFQLGISLSLRMSRQNLWLTRTVGEFLFSGYPDPLMTLVHLMPFLRNSNLPVSGNRFSWFYNRNGSSEYEGTFNMETGEHDASMTGIIREWNYKNRTDFFKAECGMVNGTDGILFRSALSREKPIEIFSSDFC
ncbi:hypothetical protein L9F63_005295, partial [Diploptera punctata]